MKIRQAVSGDIEALVSLRSLLWPRAASTHRRELGRFFNRGHTGLAAIFVAEQPGKLVGFLELGLRNYAEGTSSTCVPYIEGWYVLEDERESGFGAQLVDAARQWARSGGYTELGSDTDTDNTISIAAHKALGFKEVERQVCFLLDI